MKFNTANNQLPVIDSEAHPLIDSVINFSSQLKVIAKALWNLVIGNFALGYSIFITNQDLLVPAKWAIILFYATYV